MCSGLAPARPQCYVCNHMHAIRHKLVMCYDSYTQLHTYTPTLQMWVRGRDVCSTTNLSGFTIVYRLYTHIPSAGMGGGTCVVQSGGGSCHNKTQTTGISTACMCMCMWMHAWMDIHHCSITTLCIAVLTIYSLLPDTYLMVIKCDHWSLIVTVHC